VPELVHPEWIAQDLETSRRRARAIAQHEVAESNSNPVEPDEKAKSTRSLMSYGINALCSLYEGTLVAATSMGELICWEGFDRPAFTPDLSRLMRGHAATYREHFSQCRDPLAHRRSKNEIRRPQPVVMPQIYHNLSGLEDRSSAQPEDDEEEKFELWVGKNPRDDWPEELRDQRQLQKEQEEAAVKIAIRCLAPVSPCRPSRSRHASPPGSLLMPPSRSGRIRQSQFARVRGEKLLFVSGDQRGLVKLWDVAARPVAPSEFDYFDDCYQTHHGLSINSGALASVVIGSHGSDNAVLAVTGLPWCIQPQAFSSTGSSSHCAQVASGCSAGYVRLWDVEKRVEARNFADQAKRHQRSIRALLSISGKRETTTPSVLDGSAPLHVQRSDMDMDAVQARLCSLRYRLLDKVWRLRSHRATTTPGFSLLHEQYPWSPLASSPLTIVDQFSLIYGLHWNREQRSRGKMGEYVAWRGKQDDPTSRLFRIVETLSVGKPPQGRVSEECVDEWDHKLSNQQVVAAIQNAKEGENWDASARSHLLRAASYGRVDDVDPDTILDGILDAMVQIPDFAKPVASELPVGEGLLFASGGSRWLYGYDLRVPLAAISLEATRVPGVLTLAYIPGFGDTGEIVVGGGSSFWDSRETSRFGSANCLSPAIPPVGLLASAGWDRSITLWDLRNLSKPYFKLEDCHARAITSLNVLPTGELVSASRDFTTKFWDIGSLLESKRPESEKALSHHVRESLNDPLPRRRPGHFTHAPNSQFEFECDPLGFPSPVQTVDDYLDVLFNVNQPREPAAACVLGHPPASLTVLPSGTVIAGAREIVGKVGGHIGPTGAGGLYCLDSYVRLPADCLDDLMRGASYLPTPAPIVVKRNEL